MRILILINIPYNKEYTCKTCTRLTQALVAIALLIIKLFKHDDKMGNEQHQILLDQKCFFSLDRKNDQEIESLIYFCYYFAINFLNCRELLFCKNEFMFL